MACRPEQKCVCLHPYLLMYPSEFYSSFRDSTDLTLLCLNFSYINAWYEVSGIFAFPFPRTKYTDGELFLFLLGRIYIKKVQKFPEYRVPTDPKIDKKIIRMEQEKAFNMLKKNLIDAGGVLRWNFHFFLYFHKWSRKTAVFYLIFFVLFCFFT